MDKYTQEIIAEYEAWKELYQKDNAENMALVSAAVADFMCKAIKTQAQSDLNYELRNYFQKETHYDQ